MNIIFTIKTNTFSAAAAIEKVLTTEGLKYTARVDDKPSLGSGRRGHKRVVIGKAELAAVLQCIASHHSWTQREIAKSTGVSLATVGRIANGTHVLQSNGEDNEASIQQE